MAEGFNAIRHNIQRGERRRNRKNILPVDERHTSSGHVDVSLKTIDPSLYLPAIDRGGRKDVANDVISKFVPPIIDRTGTENVEDWKIQETQIKKDGESLLTDIDRRWMIFNAPPSIEQLSPEDDPSNPSHNWQMKETVPPPYVFYNIYNGFSYRMQDDGGLISKNTYFVKLLTSSVNDTVLNNVHSSYGTGFTKWEYTKQFDCSSPSPIDRLYVSKGGRNVEILFEGGEDYITVYQGEEPKEELTFYWRGYYYTLGNNYLSHLGKYNSFTINNFSDSIYKDLITNIKKEEMNGRLEGKLDESISTSFSHMYDCRLEGTTDDGNSGLVQHYALKGEMIPVFKNCEKVKDTSWMFACSKKLNNIKNCLSPTLSLTNAEGMFYYCQELEQLPKYLYTGNCTNLSKTLTNCSNLLSLPDGWTTISATDTERLYEGCAKIKEFAIKDCYFKDSNNMKSVFYQCNSVDGELKLFLPEKIKGTWKVGDINGKQMFANMGKVKKITFLNEDGKVDWSIFGYVSSCFIEDQSLEEIEGIINNIWDDMSFYYCYRLKEVRFANINKSLSLNYSPFLSKETIDNVFSSLQYVEERQKLSLHEKIKKEGKVSEEMIEEAAKKNWEIMFYNSQIPSDILDEEEEEEENLTEYQLLKDVLELNPSAYFPWEIRQFTDYSKDEFGHITYRQIRYINFERIKDSKKFNIDLYYAETTRGTNEPSITTLPTYTMRKLIDENGKTVYIYSSKDKVSFNKSDIGATNFILSQK